MLQVLQHNDAAIPLARVSDLAAFERQWRDLTRRSAPHTMAQTYEFALATLEQALEAKRKAFLVAAGDGDRLTGILGLTLEGGFHRTLRPFSCGSHEEYGGPLLEAGREYDSTLRLLRAARSIAADRLTICNLEHGGPVDAALEASPVRQTVEANEACVVSSGLYHSWSDAERTMSRSDRQILRRNDRRLREAHPQTPIVCGWCETAENSSRALAFLMASKRQWLASTRRRSKWLNKPNVPAFLERLIRKTDLQRFPIMSEIRVGDRTIAASVCLHNEFKIDYLINAVDPEYLRYSPTKMLIRFMSEYALDRGRDFDFCVSISAYKQEWPVEIRNLRTRTLLLSPLGQCPSPSELRRNAAMVLGPYKRRAASALGLAKDRAVA